MQLLAPNESFGHCLRRVDACGTIVRDTRLAPSVGVPVHAHAASYACLVLDGRYTEHGDGARGEQDCAAGSLLTHAAGHVHANRVGSAGARCVNIELDEALLRDGPLRALVPFLHGDRHVRLPASLAPLRRLADALAEDDDLAPLQVHTAALDLLCAAARAAPLEAAARRGAVLDRVVECLARRAARDSHAGPRRRPASAPPDARVPPAARRDDRRLRAAAPPRARRRRTAAPRAAAGRDRAARRLLRPGALHARVPAAIRRHAGPAASVVLSARFPSKRAAGVQDPAAGTS